MSVLKDTFKISLKKRAVVIIFFALTAFAGSLLTAKIFGIPAPRYHDEFSYLLAADTFSQGRIANPPHPMRSHFETFYVLQSPAYMSIYPPIQGAILALGKSVFGHPIFGVWLSVTAMSAAICWMLYAWFPPRWAAVGTGIAILLFGPLSYWGQSYWGGANAAIGGALLFGALRRILRHPRIRDSLALGIGLVILANTRPYEGLVASLPAAIVLARNLIRLPWKVSLLKVFIPLLLVAVPAAIMMGFYNKQLTGNALTLPGAKACIQNPIFLWQSPHPNPLPQHKAMARNEEQKKIFYSKKRSLKGFVLFAVQDFFYFFIFYFANFLMVPLLLYGARIIRRRWMKFSLGVIALTVMSSFLLSFYSLPHYFAPVTCLVIVLLTQGLRFMRRTHFGRNRTGKIIFLLLFLFTILSQGMRFTIERKTTQSPSLWNHQKLAIMDRLQKEAGKNLIFVRYAPNHNPKNEWVYNEAGIDNSKIVWAREMTPEENKNLVRYFKNRRVWLVKADAEEVKLTPYAE